ncbi:MAG: HEAT repeat domain-containing protein [Planctomycetota bacterium]
MFNRSLFYLPSALIVFLLCTPGLAEDGAHGGDADAAASESFKPGEAVKAPRTTERYSEKGVTIDPVAIDIAPNGDIYVAEGSRAGGSVIDNRNAGLRKSNGVINDLQKTSVEDRLEQIRMLTEGGFYPPDTFTKASDRVRLVKDTDGDGKADTSVIFADGFNDPLDGIASGVLYHDGKVYLTNIPNLWLLEDKDGDGDADKETDGERTSLSYGWGIRWAFYGHDMHGLIKGPDGRIYFSIGDRGFNVTTKEGKQLYGPDQGAVFRMWPDGTGLELYFEGLRNPQELAFDSYGNLFTGDNNSDGGDKARFVYLPEGGHSGWSQDVQSLQDRGPWNREHMWKPRDVEKYGLDQPAWIIPPLKNVGRGPSGIVHYPGTGDVFPSNGSFLLCDYPAGIRHVYVEPDGAGFKVVEDSSFVDGGTITDVTWGYDGRLYLSDWGGGWRPNPNGYLKTMVNPAAHEAQAKQIAEVKRLFEEGVDTLSDEKLIELLGHADQRVRIHAQWELANRPGTARMLAAVLSIENWPESERNQTLTPVQAPVLHRLHAAWALGIQARKNPKIARSLVPGLGDTSEHVRAQVAALLGDLGYVDAADQLYSLLRDNSPIVQCHAGIALGKIGSAEHIGLLLELLERNNNEDFVIRHAASYGLSLIGDADAINKEAQTKGDAARLGAVLALRRLESPLLTGYLTDEDPFTAAEAARAIYDKKVMDAMPALAALSDTVPLERMSEPVMRRVIEANVRLGDIDSAVRLARFAARAEAPEQWRLMALQELDGWASERNRDGVWGWWWPRPEQEMAYATSAMITHLPAITGDGNNKIATLARTMMQRHVTKSGPEELAKLALSPDEPEPLRLGVLQMLKGADATLAIDTAKQVSASTDATTGLRMQARLALLELDKPSALASYAEAIESGELTEQQDAIARLAKYEGEVVGEAFKTLTTKLQRRELDPGLKLDVVQAVSSNQALPSDVRLVVQRYVEQNQVAAEAPFIREVSLVGGSVERGREIFLNHESAQCQRCHAADGSDSVGPGLNGIAAIYDANYLYTALVKPADDIAKGYANSTVRLINGQTLSGRIVQDQSTDELLVLTNADGDTTPIPRDQIDGLPITSDQSLMPTMTDKLTPMQLRDVLAYLGSLTSDPSPAYRTGGSGGVAKASGPQVVKAASNWNHALLLPVTLLSITAALVVLLLGTMVGAKMPKL